MRILGIVIALISFLLLILGHEFGHFSVGKLLGFKINEFSVGMGPLLWSDKKGETQYSFRAIPLGGYCAFEGEDGDEKDENGVVKEPDPRSFNRQPAWKKLSVLLAGSFNNIVIGLLILTVVFTIMGSYSPVLEAVPADKPAAAAGIQPGDKVVAVNGTHYDEWLDITQAIQNNEDSDVDITVLRDGKEIEFKNVKIEVSEDNRKVIGIQCSLEHSVGTAVKTAFNEAGSMIRALRDFFVRLFSGKASSDDVGSIIQIIDISGDYAVSYGLLTVIYLIGLVSVNLGFMNLLPIPGLDGGRILFVIVRWITRGKVSDKTEAIINSVFMFLLFGLMIGLMVKDVVHMIR